MTTSALNAINQQRLVARLKQDNKNLLQQFLWEAPPSQQEIVQALTTCADRLEARGVLAGKADIEVRQHTWRSFYPAWRKRWLAYVWFALFKLRLVSTSYTESEAPSWAVRIFSFEYFSPLTEEECEDLGLTFTPDADGYYRIVLDPQNHFVAEMLIRPVHATRSIQINVTTQ